MPKSIIQGLALAKAYYLEIGEPLLAPQFPHIWSRIALGLVGEGSDCLGFDDLYSRDHDWGPGFCLFLTNEDYAASGAKLKEAYAALPSTFLGFKRFMSPGGSCRVGVFRTSDFYRSLTGFSQGPQTLEEWSRVPEEFLAKATSGEIFRDDLGIFSKIRSNLLGYYPKDLRLKKLALEATRMAQSGQYNYPRGLKRGERVAAAFALNEFMRSTISMAHILNYRYTPFSKWAHRSLLTLPRLSFLHEKLNLLINETSSEKVVALIEEICCDIRQEWREQNLVEGTETFLLPYGYKLIEKIEDEALRSLPPWQE